MLTGFVLDSLYEVNYAMAFPESGQAEIKPISIEAHKAFHGASLMISVVAVLSRWIRRGGFKVLITFS